jgi:hypothetical protein
MNSTAKPNHALEVGSRAGLVRFREPGHRVTVALARPVGRVAELGSFG